MKTQTEERIDAGVPSAQATADSINRQACEIQATAKVAWTQGYPKMIGHYDCKLEDGRSVIVKYFPGSDSEIHPYMEILNCGIVAHRCIPGQTYRSPESLK